MNHRLFGMLAETSIHPGSGQDAGFVDLPVAREKATDFPVIVGSSLKGALKNAMRDAELENLEQVFGRQEDAGQLIVVTPDCCCCPSAACKERIAGRPVRSFSIVFHAIRREPVLAVSKKYLRLVTTIA